MKIHSITRRLVFYLVITVVFVSAVTIALFYSAFVGDERNELHEKASEFQAYLVGTLELALWDLDLNSIRGICETFFQNELVVKLIVMDDSDVIIYSMEKEHGSDLVNRSAKIYLRGEYLGKFEFSLTKRYVAKASRKLLLTNATTILFILSSLLVVAGVLVRRLLKNPLDDLDSIVRGYAAGHYDAKTDELPYLEFRPFGKVLTQMGQSIKKHQSHLEELVDERTAELIVAKEQAEATRITAEEANAAKSDFLARMSHEIRTPLNAVTGLTNIVLKSKLTDEQRDYLSKVQIAANNLLEVINDILDFSKVEAGQLDLAHAPFDLDQVLEQLTDLFSNRLGHKDVELIFTMAPDVPRQLTGDAGRLTQVLTNLVENAVKFTETGEIVIRVKTKDEGQGTIGNRQQLNFEVSDTGAGIAADVLPTLFDPFTQVESYLNRKHEGTGLGLAICRRLVELMGGRIWVESTPGRGSTFYFTVMLTPQKEEKSLLSLPADLHGLRALVVDDSESSRQVLIDLLESFTFNVAAVDSGEKAILGLRQESYQLVLLDWKMPGMDGIETARCIRELEHCEPEASRRSRPHRRGNNKSQTPIIILVTAYGQEIVRERIDTATVDTMLFKPVKASQLFNTIMELFGEKEAAAGVVSRMRKPSTPPLHQLIGRRVLVVEDSELNRDVAVALLEEAGLAVEVAENGHLAVSKVTKSPRGYYDAVLMDIQMPVMNGYQATNKIREFEKQQDATADQPVKNFTQRGRGTNTPIIALTAHALKGEKEKCLAADMDDYLSKPLDERTLHRVLLKWIAS